MNVPPFTPRLWVLSVLISLLAFITGHLWRHAELQTALLATGACAVAVLTAASLASDKATVGYLRRRERAKAQRGEE